MSKTDHARPPRKRQSGEHKAMDAYYAEREHSDLLAFRKERDLTHLTDHLLEAQDEPEVIDDMPGLKRLGALDYRRRYDWMTHVDGTEACDDEFDINGPERMADWELELLGVSPDTKWHTESPTSHVWADEPEPDTHYGDPAEVMDLDDEDDWHWLAHSPQDFFDAVGEAWVIEGPSVRPEPLRENYVRVWELAERLGVESKHVIEVLRLAGEYVKTHQSFVADVVADAIMLSREFIVAKYGEREDRAPQATLRYMLLQEDQRAKITLPGARAPMGAFAPRRPGAPRPGSNPFTYV